MGKSETAGDKHRIEIWLVVNVMRKIERGERKESVGEVRDKILA